MSGIAGGEDPEKLAERMSPRDVAILEEDGEAVVDGDTDVGGYASARRDDGKVVLSRDRLGIRPLFYATNPFAFASERQALECEGMDARELHPRQELAYDLGSKSLEVRNRDFFEIDVVERDIQETAEQVEERVLEAVDTLIDRPVALLFSGGLDSTVLARALQECGKDFTCYTAGIQHGNVDPPRDVVKAKEISEMIGVDLEVEDATLNDVETALPQLADRLSTSSPVKLGVALPAYIALRNADESRVVTGLGAEQLYAGYSRQREDEINRECRSGLRSLFHQDLYRDNVLAAMGGRELRLPFLTEDIVRHSLTIPGDQKVRDGYRKYVLRKAAERLDVPDEAAWRGKTAAQYGSNVDKAIGRLARDRDMGKQEYCNRFRDRPENVVGVLFSGGKDSNAALYRMLQRGNEIACLINLRSQNQDSYMFDTKEEDVVRKQAEALGLPVLFQETAGEKETELADLDRALAEAREEYGIEGIASGALKSMYQKERVEEAAERAGLKSFGPLWNEDQESYMRWLVSEGFEIMVTDVAAAGLDGSWEGTVLNDERLKELLELADEHGFHPAGEGGGFETVVLDGPTFNHSITMD